jgi:ureidoglycolate hydrolase
VCLGPAACGDDVTPADMRAFYVPAGKGVYFHPGTWHNGVYVAKDVIARLGGDKATFLTRQGRVHSRFSASWAEEFGCVLRVPLTL